MSKNINYEELFDTIMNSSVSTMKTYLSTSKEELPILFSFVMKNGEIVQIPYFLYSRIPDKRLIALFIQRACDSLKPIAVVMTSECWYLEAKDSKDFLDNRNKYGSVREMPESIEGFNIILSYSKNNKPFANTYSAPIIKDEKGNRLLDESRATKNVGVESAEGATFYFSPKILTSIS